MRNWIPLETGRHRGKTLPQILFSDPDWFFWAWEERWFHGKSSAQDAALIHRRATSIRIPPTHDGEQRVVEYLAAWDGSFGGLDIVPVSTPPTRHAIRAETIDMSYPRRDKSYDKLGCKLLVDGIREGLFKGTRLTKARVEAFFDDESNFVAARKSTKRSWTIRPRRRAVRVRRIRALRTR